MSLCLATRPHPILRPSIYTCGAVPWITGEVFVSEHLTVIVKLCVFYV